MVRCKRTTSGLHYHDTALKINIYIICFIWGDLDGRCGVKEVWGYLGGVVRTRAIGLAA